MDWETLRKDCLACTACGLCEMRHNVVFGVGSERAEVLFIGEGPGEQEDLRGEPFVGRGGQLLDKYLDAIGLSRKSNIYIGNMVKCRPPQNRDPKPEEAEQCLPWLRETVKIMKPKIIVCVGRIAAQIIIDKNFRVTKEHGVFFDRKGTLLMGTFHPAALLRDPRRKGDCFEDFLKLQDKIKELGIKI